MKRTARWLAVLFALAVVVCLAPARAANLVVVEARGIGLKPGQMVDGEKPLLLREGQHVTLIAVDGVTLKLDGPFENSPAEAATRGRDVLGAAVQGLLTQSTSRQEGGFTRAAEQVDMPDPWLLDVSRRGDVCLRQGDKPVFWRESAVTEAKLSVVPGDHTWKAEATWPAGADRLVVARDIPVRDGSTFLVALNGEASAITVRTVPAMLLSDEMRAAWMAHQGCRSQAEALVRTLH
jgi:hypothetical protein